MEQKGQSKDSVAAAIARNLSLKRLKQNLQRAMDCLKTRGVEATVREFKFRLALALHAEIWMYRADLPLRREIAKQRRTQLEKKPLVSVVVPLYNPPRRFFVELLDSVLHQSYRNLELILVDAGDGAQSRKILKRYKDERIVYQKIENNGISDNTTVGLKLAKGELITLLDHDDLLYKNALFEVVTAYNSTGAEVIYSDEIILSHDCKKLREFHFKPDYSPHYLACCNYITHLCVFGAKLIDRVGRYEKSDYEGAGDHDLILRLCEKANKVYHIPKILYIWRGHDGSTASDMSAKPYAVTAGARAITDHLDRIGQSANVTPQKNHPGAFYPRYKKADGSVSVVIPNYEHKEDLERCLDTLYKNAGIDDFEVIVVENNSKSSEIFAFYDRAVANYKNLKVVKYNDKFNFSAVCNLGVENSNGDHVLLLNNDIEIISPDFVREMLCYSCMENVGAVGAKLYYPNEKIQHAGVFIGINNSAGHSHKSHPSSSGGDMYRLCTAQNMLAVTGAALMVKRKLYIDQGGLNERDFAIAFNDVDLCLRLYRNGYYNVMTPFAVAYHHESLSRGTDEEGENNLRFERELLNLREKYADIFRDGDPFYNPHLTTLDESYGWR